MDRFDLENHITNLHSIVDSLNDISFGILEGDFTKDETVNAVDGLAVLTKAKIEKLYNVFIQAFHLDEYKEDTFDYSQLKNTQEEWI